MDLGGKAVGAEAEEQVPPREVAVPEACIVEPPRRPPQRRDESGEVDLGEALFFLAGAGGAEEIDAPRSDRGDSGRHRRPGPPRPRTQSTAPAPGSRARPPAGRSPPASSFRPCSPEAGAFQPVAESAVAELLDDHLDGSRRDLHPGHVEVVAPPVEGLQGGGGIGQGADRRRRDRPDGRPTPARRSSRGGRRARSGSSRPPRRRNARGAARDRSGSGCGPRASAPARRGSPAPPVAGRARSRGGRAAGAPGRRSVRAGGAAPCAG